MVEGKHPLRFVAILFALPLFVGACSSGQIAQSTPSPVAPFSPSNYPISAAADCTAAGYTGEFKQIKALDAQTVEFDLCGSDVAFLSKIALPSFGINSAAYLQKTVPDLSILTQPNGTGPYVLKEWVKGDHMTFAANPKYWGPAPAAKTVVLRWSTQTAQRTAELLAGTVDGIDNVGPTDYSTLASNSSYKLISRLGLNVFYLGFNVDDAPWNNVLVRQAIAMGVDRQRIVSNFFPKGSTVATHFTPCVITYGCAGDDWYAFDPVKAKALLAQAGYPNGFKQKLQYRDVVRAYLPNPGVIAQDIQAQLKQNLNIDLTLDVQESTTFINNQTFGHLDGLFLLGNNADYSDVTDFLDQHFGPGLKKFGTPFPDVVAALHAGDTTGDPTARQTAYTTANNLVRQYVPMVPVANGGSATAWRSGIQNAYSSPFYVEEFGLMKPGSGSQLVFMQGAEPNSLYCGDEGDQETARACAQITEPLYQFLPGKTDPAPDLATACKPNNDASVWTCTLRRASFADGTPLTATDVLTSFAVQWDAANPLHKGRQGAFVNFVGFFGGLLNSKSS
jgi:peptide/nickel transport system substrate-binding protein